MSFPKTLAAELLKLSCVPSGSLAWALPAGAGGVRWHLSVRTLGFNKDQVDAALRYRHPHATDFGWHCLAQCAGPRWPGIVAAQRPSLSGGFAIGPLAGWRDDHTFDNRGLSPDEAAQHLAADVQAKVMPFVAGLDSDTPLLNLLTQDEEPYPWFRSQGLTRLAEVAMLEAQLGTSPSSVPPLAERHRRLLQEQLDGVELPQYIACILAAASAALPASQPDRCPRCGGNFACGAAGPAPCACLAVTLSAALQDDLRARYAGCLCMACLRDLAAQERSPDTERYT